mgnify:CR=1 FL=1
MTSSKVRGAKLSKREVAAYRRALGESQEVAAGHAQCSSKQIGRWERGQDPDYWRAFNEAMREIKRLSFGDAWSVARAKLRSPDENVALRAAHEIIASVDRDSPQKHELMGEDGGAIVIVYDEERDEGDGNT